MQDYRKLKAWQQAHQLNLALFAATRRVAREEPAALIGDVRRAGVDLAAGLIDACAQTSDEDFTRVLRRVQSGCSTLEYHLVLLRDLTLLDGNTFAGLTDELATLREALTALLKKHVGEGSPRKGKLPY